MSETSSDKSTKLRRLWVVSELYFPEETSTGYYMTRIAEGLADNFETHAVSGYPNYLYKGSKVPRFEVRNRVSIHRLFSTRFDKNSIPLKALNMLTFGLAVFIFALHRFKTGDRVLVVTTPPTIPFFIAIASLIKGLGMTLLIHDTYPEILHASGKMSKDSFAFSLLQSIKNWIYKLAEGIIVVGRDMEELVRKQTSGLDARIVNIPNWAELETVFPDEVAGREFRDANGLGDAFVVLYAGNMGYPNDLETIVDAATILRSDERFKFVFLGGGAKLSFLKASIENRDLRNVLILPPHPRHEQNRFLNSCDLGVVSLVNEMTGVSVPSRTYNLLATGKPILGIVDYESEVGRLIKEEQIGFLVQHGNAQELVRVLLDVISHKRDLEEMGHRARESAVRNFNSEKALDRYRQFLG